jgi:hypothetical protein
MTMTEERDPLKEAWGDVGAKFGEAFEQLGTALKELGRKLGGVVNDEQLRDQAKQAAQSLDGALSKTVDTVGDQVDSLVRKVTKRTPKAAVDDTSPIDASAQDSDIVDADVVVEHDEHDAT